MPWHRPRHHYLWWDTWVCPRLCLWHLSEKWPLLHSSCQHWWVLVPCSHRTYSLSSQHVPRCCSRHKGKSPDSWRWHSTEEDWGKQSIYGAREQWVRNRGALVLCSWLGISAVQCQGCTVTSFPSPLCYFLVPSWTFGLEFSFLFSSSRHFLSDFLQSIIFPLFLVIFHFLQTRKKKKETFPNSGHPPFWWENCVIFIASFLVALLERK